MGNKIIIENENQENNLDNTVFTETVKKVADFDFNISRSAVINQLPFMFYCCLLIILTIWNGHSTEKLIRYTDTMTKENKALRSEYISVMSEMMSQSMQSEIAKKLNSSGIKESKKPPQKITSEHN